MIEVDDRREKFKVKKNSRIRLLATRRMLFLIVLHRLIANEYGKCLCLLVCYGTCSSGVLCNSLEFRRKRKKENAKSAKKIVGNVKVEEV